MKKTNYLLCAVLFLLPFYRSLFFIEIGIITFNAYSLGIVALTLMAIGRHIFASRIYEFTLLDIFIALFCITFFISTLLSDDFLKSNHMAFKAIFLPTISYFVIKTFVDNEKEYIRSFMALVIGIAVFAVLGIFQAGITPQRQMILSQNPIAVASLTVLPILTIFFNNWWRNKYWAILLIFSILLFFITYSRIYFLCLLISPIIYWVIRKGHVFKLFLAVFPLTFAFTLFLYTDPEFRYKYVPKTKLQTASRVLNQDFYKKSFSQRARQIQEGFHEFAKRPVLGHGIKPASANVTIHNLHVEWLEYGGILGYLMGLGIFLTHYISQRKSVQKDVLNASNLCIITVIIINCFFNGIMHGIMPFLVFILMAFGQVRRGLIQKANE